MDGIAPSFEPGRVPAAGTPGRARGHEVSSQHDNKDALQIRSAMPGAGRFLNRAAHVSVLIFGAGPNLSRAGNTAESSSKR